MATQLPQDVSFVVTLEGERIRLRDFIGTLRDLLALLQDVEKKVRHAPNANVSWTWGEDNPLLEVVGTVNGVSAEELTRIVTDARQGFVSAEEAATQHQPVDWPKTFGQSARTSAQRILRRMEHLEGITVAAAELPPVRTETAATGEVINAQGRKRRAFHSAVDGRLDLISRRGRLRATIREHNSGALVRCIFADEMIDSIKGLFDERVVVEGMVVYRADGTPVSISDVTDVRLKPKGRPLREFIGAVPNLTGGRSVDEFLAGVHGDE